MIGAIIGDVVGSRFEFNNIHTKEFKLFDVMSTFTDDSVLTVATADVILNGGSYLKKYQKSYFNYPNRGWGGRFLSMASSGNLRPYDSFGNGSAMRVSPVGWVYDSYAETLEEAQRTAEVTHSHPEGIKGAQAIAGAIYWARQGATKAQIMDHVTNVGYDLSKPLSAFPSTFDETCQGTIPLCMAIFDQATDYEDAVRSAIAQGGDVDTTACIVGGMAEAFYGQPSEDLIKEAYGRMPDEMCETVTKFLKKYCYKDFVEPSVTMGKAEKLQDAFRSLWSS